MSGAIWRALLLSGALLAPSALEARVDRTGRDWVSAVVSKIAEAGRGESGQSGGTVTIRVRVAADGSVDGVSIDEGSGSADLDERAIRAVKAAGPFRPPPAQLLTLEGFTELSFPLELRGKARRRGEPRTGKESDGNKRQ